MQTVDQDKVALESTKRAGFWRRQFHQTSTSAQRKFDWAFGVVIPIICVVFDPVVFRGNALGVATLGNYKAFAYLLSFASIMAMAAWLTWGEKLKWVNAFVAGLFFFGSFVSLTVGILILPISLFGLVILIGILGFTPLFAGLVYLRNGIKAFRSAGNSMPAKTLVYSTALATIFSFAIPFVVNAEIRKSLDAIRDGDIETVLYESKKLRLLSPLVNFDVMAKECHQYSDEAKLSPKMQIIGQLYADMTGRNIERPRLVLRLIQ